MEHRTIRIIDIASKVAAFASICLGVANLGKTAWTNEFGFFVLAPVVLTLPVMFYKKYHRHTYTPRFIVEVSLLIFLGVALTTAGGEWLYQSVPYFDSVVHFSSGILLTILAAIFFNKAWRAGTLTPWKAFLYGAIFTSIGNEIYEAFSDWLLHTRLWGDPFKPLVFDTVTDIALQVAGGLIGALILSKFFNTWLKLWLRAEETP
jgi:hypothetical protein